MAFIPRNKAIPREKFLSMQAANPDGWGLFFVLNGRVRTIKSTEKWDIKDDFRLNVDSVLHFRTASSSNIGEEFCHPFKVNDNLYFAMNGNLFEFQSYFGEGFKDNLTDSQRFNKIVLKMLPDGFLNIGHIRKSLEKYCVSNQVKMIFMDSDGNTHIINEIDGEWIDGIWYSNKGIENYTGYGYSGVHEYTKGEIRHKGGIISNLFLHPERRNRWHKCCDCKGYFKESLLGADGFCYSCCLLRLLKEYCHD